MLLCSGMTQKDVVLAPSTTSANVPTEASWSKVLVTLLYLVAPPYGNNSPVVEVMYKAFVFFSFEFDEGFGQKGSCGFWDGIKLAGGLKYFLFSPLPVEMI